MRFGTLVQPCPPFTATTAVATRVEVGLAGAIGQWSAAWLPLPAAPHIEVLHFGNPKAIGALVKAPYAKLPPEDVALLDADPDKRQRYCELVARSWVPPLRVLCEVFMTQVGAPIAARRRHTFLADACAGAGAPQGLRPSHTV
jgi:hypothetical protein